MRQAPVFLTILLSISSLLLVSFIAAQLNGFFTIQNQGTVTSINISIYSDSACTEPLTAIHWGSIKVGETKTSMAYLRNEGTLAVTVTLSVGDWVPSASSGALSLTWDSENAQVEVGNVQPVVFSLKALNNNVTGFAFRTIVTGIET